MTTFQLDRFKTNCLKGFITNNAGQNEVCNCMVETIQYNFPPSVWNAMSKLSRNSTWDEVLNNCYISTNNLALRDAEQALKEAMQKEQAYINSRVEQINQIVKNAKAAALLNNYTEARVLQIEAIDAVLSEKRITDYYGTAWLADAYNNLAWWSLLNKDVDIVGEYLQKGFSYNSSNMYLRGNLGLYNLIKGNYAEAEQAFTYYKRKAKYPDGSKWVNVVAEDLKLMEAKGLGNKDFARIRTLLKIKM
ncbi:MAG: hypothetical protein IPO21_13140 [Bacteroidales bacterium]|nr:hypothetical protein [Bacteroidales bacterium]